MGLESGERMRYNLYGIEKERSELYHAQKRASVSLLASGYY